VNAELNYRNPLVRDLAWALSSPPLLQRADPQLRWLENGWFREISLRYAGALKQLERDPRPLQDMVDARKDRRLGSYFETLWKFWLNSNQRYRLLFANLPLRTASRTLGEFDFLVKDNKSGKTLHWEVAVKFYLGVADTSQPVNWLGPAQRDRLDIKTSRLLNHQSRLSHRPEAVQLFEQLGIEVDETWVILKGRLFYPAGIHADTPRGICPDHLKGFWSDQRSLAALDTDGKMATHTAAPPALCGSRCRRSGSGKGFYRSGQLAPLSHKVNCGAREGALGRRSSRINLSPTVT